MKKVTKKEDKNLYSLGEKIGYLRTNAGMSQQELATKMNIKREKINRIENNTEGRNLSINELNKIADIFNVSTDYLLGRVESRSIDNTELSKELGLTDKSIENIKLFNFVKNQNAKQQKDKKYTIDAINNILENKSLLGELGAYINYNPSMVEEYAVKAGLEYLLNERSNDTEIENIENIDINNIILKAISEQINKKLNELRLNK